MVTTKRHVSNLEAFTRLDGNFYVAFDNSAKNVQDIANDKGEPGKYDQAIKEARAYKECLKAHGLLPGGES